MVDLYIEEEKTPNKSFNLINPLARFVQKSHAQNAPNPSGTDLKVKPMLEGRYRADTIRNIDELKNKR